MHYYEPNFIGEALVVLDRFGERAKVLAGGTLLGPHLRANPGAADALVNLKRIHELSEIRIDGDTLLVGALATARSIARDPLVKHHAPLLSTAASSLGAPALRTVATIGGNVLSSHHAADMACALLACDAAATIAKLDDEMLVLSVEQMLSPGFAGLRAGSLLAGFRIPTAVGSRCAFEKMQTRQAFELALVSVGASLRLRPSGDVADARIALGGAAETPIRAIAAERAIAGGGLSDARIARAAHAASEVDAEPRDDERASTAFRRQLVRTLVTRALDSIRRTSMEGA
ncbi:MAG TPA: FAD binding domain-containing protein [Candidatus Eremiobacteraceae bacterium]|nr:FAD binding domain-containing protein [Candidatus Eremiobacteraceae bacterium]